ncbi:hypothetical protein JW859_02455 [bacterium]|nr:hypothetical protein [bacterium]
MKRLLLLVMFGTVLLTAGCDRGVKMFDRLSTTDFGLEIAFGMSPNDVQKAIGPRAQQTSLQEGISETWHYLPPEVVTTDSDTSQLALTFHQKQLVRVFNRMHPEDEQLAPPPLFAEPLPGVKVGNRKSDFIEALGQPTNPEAGDEWRFEAKDGRKIILLARFVEIPNTNEQRCSALQVTLIPPLQELKGEQIEENENWRERMGL